MQKRELNDQNNIYIIGCGGHARSVINAIRTKGKKICITLVDENALENEIIMGCKVLKRYHFSNGDKSIVAIGDNEKRRSRFDDLNVQNGIELITIVSNTAIISDEVFIGRGCFISERAYIGPQVQIGDNTIINTGSIIEHECKIGSHTHVAPGVTVCGRTTIGEGVFVGAGSVIVDGVSICDNAIIGAGAVVVEDILESGIYIGMPARKKERN